MRDRKGYTLAVLGALAGGQGLARVAGLAVAALLPEDAVLWGLLLFAGTVALGWLGAGIGTWAALRLGGWEHAARTGAFTFALIAPLGVAMSLILTIAAPSTNSDAAPMAMGLAAVSLAPLAACWLATRPGPSSAPERGA